ncbi:hypothetical protein OG948_09345 [Embleya sp. NBC_00888]|uniref:hypothetical protein n=1 Tax=Embleya sp. NBC_00888 TaxID=2975960 RepID=UPI003868868A|nr:hypothetical protein OG948_09345 [Embleya sp. NBC_00888]
MADTGADEADRLDQIVYRWSYGNLLGHKGMGPVATSLTFDRLRDWHGGLDSHVSMDRSLPETPEWSVCRVRLEERHALILREAAIHGTNRPGNNAHVLLDPGLRVQAHTMLAIAWLHGRHGGGLTGSHVRLADVPDTVPMRGASIRSDAFDPDVHEDIRRHARDHAELVEIVLAAVLRDHRRHFTLHLDDVGPDIVPLLWGVFDLAQWVAPGRWTFSTYETSDAMVKPRFVLVPRWPNTPEPANRLRIDPRSEPQPGRDVFRDAAGILVQQYCTRPWEEVQRTLVKIDAAARPGASFLDRANLVRDLEPDATRLVRAVDPAPREDPAAGTGGSGDPGPGWSAAGYSDDPGVTGYTDTWAADDESAGFDDSYESDGSYESDESDRSYENDDPNGRDERDARNGRHPDSGYVPLDESDAWGARRNGWDTFRGDGGRISRAGERDRRDGRESDRSIPPPGGPPVPVPPRPDRLVPARPESGGSESRPALPTADSGRTGRGTTDWATWEALHATRSGFEVLELAAGEISRSNGHETREFREALERVDPDTLAVALLLAGPPLLTPVVYRLAQLVHRTHEERRRLDKHTQAAFAAVLGRLHEDIKTLDGCGVPRESLSLLLWEMTERVVAHGRLATFGTDVAGTVWRLRTSFRVWEDYRRALWSALRSTRYREPFLLEYGRLALEDLDSTPDRTEAQP